jgi:DNA-binding protein H-NS
VNILVAWRERNPLIEGILSDCGPSIVAQPTTTEPIFSSAALLSVDELWLMREEIGILLTRKISDELAALGKRLERLKAEDQGSAAVGHKNVKRISRVRRPYPPVHPRYQNPPNPSETWSGRGKQPRWLMAQLIQGKHLDDFRIPAALTHQMKPGTSDKMANCDRTNTPASEAQSMTSEPG